MTTDAFTDAARAYAEQACYQDENIPIAEAGFRAGWKAALTHLTAHDARVRRDAAREALDGYADAEEDSFLALHVKGAPISAAQCTHAAMTAREYRDTHYPYRQEQTNE